MQLQNHHKESVVALAGIDNDYVSFFSSHSLMSVGFQLACTKRSDSGEQCEVKKAMKSRGGLGREVRERL